MQSFIHSLHLIQVCPAAGPKGPAPVHPCYNGVLSTGDAYSRNLQEIQIVVKSTKRTTKPFFRHSTQKKKYMNKKGSTKRNSLITISLMVNAAIHRFLLHFFPSTCPFKNLKHIRKTATRWHDLDFSTDFRKSLAQDVAKQRCLKITFLELQSFFFFG